ncbi:META domain-containing protein [Pontibacter chinhatensis]|uniref:Heat shock protein HslJ n=1 Tax=Pontibacter chinhatensis TaxID=1436961 RepID=A0A1I2PE95_9BACT|nr:META domain-containing protein [Pontibacter chinhatensis]SFG11996.1 Heat shock protein HslJ [Pontibacter chinhatensis]
MLKTKFYLPLSLFILLLVSSCASKKAVTHQQTDTQKAATPEQVEDNPKLWQEKFEQGIDFVATGNEPFWSLELDEEGQLTFRTLSEGDQSIKIPMPAAEKVSGEEGTVYKAQTSSGPLEIRLLRQPCEDTMSGKKSPYTVAVRYKGQEYSGCGNYLSDARLERTWLLQQLRGKEVTGERLPFLSFSLSESRVSGNAGCNRISGSMEARGNKLYFGAIAATRMACPDMEIENQVLQELSKREFEYQIEKDKLRLLHNGTEVMVLQPEK